MDTRSLKRFHFHVHAMQSVFVYLCHFPTNTSLPVFVCLWLLCDMSDSFSFDLSFLRKIKHFLNILFVRLVEVLNLISSMPFMSSVNFDWIHFPCFSLDLHLFLLLPLWLTDWDNITSSSSSSQIVVLTKMDEERRKSHLWHRFTPSKPCHSIEQCSLVPQISGKSRMHGNIPAIWTHSSSVSLKPSTRILFFNSRRVFLQLISFSLELWTGFPLNRCVNSSVQLVERKREKKSVSVSVSLPVSIARPSSCRRRQTELSLVCDVSNLQEVCSLSFPLSTNFLSLLMNTSPVALLLQLTQLTQ